MKLIGLIRLGRDAEIRYTNDGTPVAGLACAWNYGRKGEDGRRPTQWADLSFWGERAEKLSQWLVKGAQFFVVADDCHIETYSRREGGEGFRLVGRIESIEFAGGGQQSQEGVQRPAAAPAARAPAPAAQRPAPAPAARPSSGFDDMDDDIPF